MGNTAFSRRRFLGGAGLASGAALLALAVAACGGSATPSPTTAASFPASSVPAGATTVPASAAPTVSTKPTTAASAASTPKAQSQPATGKVVEITYAAHGDQSWQVFWKQVVQWFNEDHPNIHATFHAEPTNTWQKYLTLMAGGTMYDIFRNEEKRLPGFVVRGHQLLEITSYIQRDKENKDDFPPTVWSEFQWEGKFYGFGHDLSPAVVFYNPKLFKDKGVDLPPKVWGDPKWDWNAFVETAKKLTSGDGAQKIFGIGGNTWWVYMDPWIWTNGGSVVADDNLTVTLDQPPAVEAWQYYADLVNVHKVMPTSAQATNGPDQLYQSNREAMDINNTSYTITLREMKDFTWDMAPYPTGKNGKVFTRIPNNICSAYAKTKQPDASWEFLKFMSSKKATIQARGVPSRISVANTPEFLSRTPDQNWKLLADSLQQRRSELLSPYFDEFDTTLTAAWQSVLDGHATVRQMVTEMKPKLTQILQGKGAQ